jgi:2-polyprenyl-3-methyl-5-hydroxy-6-metoxy-1,4-benzoquinol methylase
MPSPRTVSDKEYVHERLGDEFRTALSDYDTLRRVEVLVDEFLTDDMLQGKRVLEVGCGLGFFSERLQSRGARVLACDIGPGLVEKTRLRVGCECRVADALRLQDAFGTESFDVVLSSECIEHTPDPGAAIRQMARVLKPGGVLALSTPNVVWWPVVKAATVLKLRPFCGHENFSTFGGIRRTLAACGVRIEREQGLHAFPFQLGMHDLSRWLDRHAQAARGLMINCCILARKDGRAATRAVAA